MKKNPAYHYSCICDYYGCVSKYDFFCKLFLIVKSILLTFFLILQQVFPLPYFHLLFSFLQLCPISFNQKINYCIMIICINFLYLRFCWGFSIGFGFKPIGCHFSLSFNSNYASFFCHVRTWKKILGGARRKNEKHACLIMCKKFSNEIVHTLKYECIGHLQKTSF